MNTKWNTTFFMFLALVGAIILLHSAIYAYKNDKRPTFVLVSAVLALSSIVAIALGFNDPVKILTVIRTPQKAFSAALITQIFVATVAVFTYFYAKQYKQIVSGVAVLISLVSAFFISNIYMISTRPALNTFILTLVFVLVVVQTALLMGSYNSSHKYKLTLRAVSILVCISVAGFTLRLASLPQQDRILDIERLTSGTLAPIFWAFVIVCCVTPTAYSFVKHNSKIATAITSTVCIVGILLLNIIVAQLPMVERGINNRIFFN